MKAGDSANSKCWGWGVLCRDLVLFERTLETRKQV